MARSQRSKSMLHTGWRLGSSSCDFEGLAPLHFYSDKWQCITFNAARGLYILTPKPQIIWLLGFSGVTPHGTRVPSTDCHGDSSPAGTLQVAAAVKLQAPTPPCLPGSQAITPVMQPSRRWKGLASGIPLSRTVTISAGGDLSGHGDGP